MPDDALPTGGEQQFIHEKYGHYNQTPHADIDLDREAWSEIVRRVLKNQIGPLVAWHYEGGICFMWGNNLDESLLTKIVEACNDFEDDLADDGHYDTAKAAVRAASAVSRASVSPAGEDMIT